MNKKIVICGGHHNSALVTAEELRNNNFAIYWFGHKYSMIGDRNPSAEYLEVTKKNFPFIGINAGKFQPKYLFLVYLARIPVGFFQSLYNLLKIRPDLILSFGGYLALPVVISGWVLGIPSVTHEQTTVTGIANKIIAKFCRKIFVSFPTSLSYFPKNKTILSGLPVRKEIFTKGKKVFNNSKKTIYVVGGKQGSHILNEAVFTNLPRLLSKFNVIHQCGLTSLYNDFGKSKQLRCSLGKEKENYLVKEYFFDSEIGQVFDSADFVVSRSGAHTIYELMLLNKPVVLIPIPWSSNNEQEENAKMLVSFGLAKILPQEDLEQGKFLKTILEFDRNLDKYQLKKDLPFPKEPAEKVIMIEIKKILQVAS